MSKRALSFSKLSHAPYAHALLQWMAWWLHWGFLVAEVFLPLLPYILPQLWIFQSSRICSCTLLITWTKQRLFEPCRVLLPKFPHGLLGVEISIWPACLPSDTGIDSGYPVTAHLALGLLTTFLLLGQQLPCQWSCAGLLKTRPGCGFNCWLIPASQAVACHLYLIIVTFSRGNSEAKFSCFLLSLSLSAQRCMNVMGFLTNHLLWLFWVWHYFGLYSWGSSWSFPVANAMESQISTSPYSWTAG